MLKPLKNKIFLIVSVSLILLGAFTILSLARPSDDATSDHTNNILTLAFSPDGKVLAGGSNDNSVKLWDVDSRQEIITLKTHNDYVKAIIFAPDGKMLISGDDEGKLAFWQITGNQSSLITKTEARLFSISKLAISSDGKFLAFGGLFLKPLTLWNIESIDNIQAQNLTKLRASLKEEYSRTEIRGDTTYGLAFSDNNLLNIDGSYLQIWKIGSTQKVISYPNEISIRGQATYGLDKSAFSGDGKTIVGCDGVESKCYVWQLETDKLRLIATLEDTRIGALTISSDGKTVAAGVEGHKIRIWNLATDKSTEKNADGTKIITKPTAIYDNGHTVYAVAISPDGKLIASSGANNTIIIREVPQ